MVEQVPTEAPSGDHHEIAVDVVAKFKSGNLTASEGRDAAETAASATRDDAKEEEREEV
jgi:hypothetical protein